MNERRVVSFKTHYIYMMENLSKNYKAVKYDIWLLSKKLNFNEISRATFPNEK